MSKFRKNQLVAVKVPPDAEWNLLVFEQYLYRDPYCKEAILKRPDRERRYCVDVQFVRPAEKIWPDLFMQRDNEFFLNAVRLTEFFKKESVDKDKQIEWLCKQLADSAEEQKKCPPGTENICCKDCEACWEFVSKKAAWDDMDSEIGKQE